MVTLNFKMSSLGEVVLDAETPLPWRDVLQVLAADHGVGQSGIIAVRNGAVVASTDLILDGDSIDIFPAISGG